METLELKQADDNLQSLQLEVRHAPASERTKVAKEEAQLRTELQAIAKELEAARKEYLLGAEAGGSTEKLFRAREERKRSIAVTESLQKGHQQLKAANNEAQDTEKIGVDTLQELRRQRESIIRMKDNTSDLGSNLTDAQKAVHELEKPCSLM